MGVAALSCQKAWEDDDARTKATPDHPPTYRVPCGPRGVCHVNEEFLPDTVLPRKDWEQLKAECAVRGVSEYHLQCLFLQLCDFRDQVSLGTVPVKVFLGMFQTHFSKLLRRLVRLQAGGRRPRLLFEEAVRLILDIASMDYFTLLVVSARVIGGSEILDADGVRAIVRYIASDKVDAFSKALCKLMVCRDGVPHTLPAFVELGVRYPGLFFPVMQMQRAIQRRFLGLQFWQDFHRRNHTLLQPANFSYSGAKAVTARQVILELLSTEARPLVMGSLATRAFVPPWDSEAFPMLDRLPAADSARSSDPGSSAITHQWSDLPELREVTMQEDVRRPTPESDAATLSMGLGARHTIEDTIHEESDESDSGSDDEAVHADRNVGHIASSSRRPSRELVAQTMERAQSAKTPARAGLGGTRERDMDVLDLSANASALEPHTGAFTLVERVNATRRTLEHTHITKGTSRSASEAARIASDTANKTVGFLFAAAARGSAKREIRRDVPLSVPMPIAHSITDWARTHPSPAGASLADGPIDIARAVMLNFASGVGASIRRPFVFREDIFVEQYDENVGQMFYYNVATGDSTWRRPVRYVPLSLSTPAGGAPAGKGGH